MDIGRTLRWSINISSALALSHFKLSRNSPTHYKIVRWRSFFSMGLICIFVTMPPLQGFVTGFWNVGSFERTLTGFTWYLTGPIVITITLTNNLAKQKQICEVVNAVCNVSSSVQRLTGETIHTPLRWYLTNLLCIWLLLVAVDHQYWTNHCIRFLIEYSELLYFILMLSYFSTYVMVISALLYAFKKGLNSFLESEQWPSSILKSKKAIPISTLRDTQYTTCSIVVKAPEEKKSFQDNVIDLLVHYRILYHDIFEISRKLNRLFGTTNVAVVGHLGIITVTEAFNFYHILQRPSGGEISDMFLKVETLPWAIMGLILLGLFISPCTQVAAKSNGIVSVVNKFLAKSKADGAVADELHKFSTILIHEKISFAPHDMFTLSNGLILTILGLAVSYFVLLTQVPRNA